MRYKNKILKNLLLLLFISFTLFGCSNSTNSGRTSKYNDKEEYFLLRGENYSQEGKYIEAIKEFEEAYKKNPKNVIVLLELGYCYAELGDQEASISYYQKALLREPKNPIALKNLAYMNYKNKNFKASEQYLGMFPKNLDDSFVLKLKGFLAIENKKYETAYDYLAKAHSLTTQYNEELYVRSAEVLRALKQDNVLYTFLENKYAVHKNNPQFIAFYASTLDKNYNELLSSERVLKRYMAENPKNDALLILLAKNNLKQSKSTQAANILTLVSNRSLYTPQYLEVKEQLAQRNSPLKSTTPKKSAALKSTTPKNVATLKETTPKKIVTLKETGSKKVVTLKETQPKKDVVLANKTSKKDES